MSKFNISLAIKQLYPNAIVAAGKPEDATPQEQYDSLIWDDVAATTRKTPNPRPTLKKLISGWKTYYLPILKAEKKDAINALRDDYESKPIKYKGNTYDAKGESYAAISGFAFDNVAEDFIDANNVVRHLEGPDFAAIRTLMCNQRTAVRLNANALKSQVDTLKTLIAVEDFDINVGNPEKPGSLRMILSGLHWLVRWV